MIAALKVYAAADFAATARAIAGPAVSPEDHTAQDMSIVAEVACALTVSERTGSGLLGEAHRLTTALPLTLAALQAGTISWQHARIMVDETTNLDPAAAAALEAHFLDPEAPNPARGPAGEMMPARFRAKARTWRERHHPVSIEQRHTKVVPRTGGWSIPGPGRHGLALGLPARRSGRRDLEPRHHRRPRPPRPHRGQDPHPAPRRHRRGLAPAAPLQPRRRDGLTSRHRQPRSW